MTVRIEFLIIFWFMIRIEWNRYVYLVHSIYLVDDYTSSTECGASKGEAR